ncbi:PIN domain-containing protein [Kitasatospora sp. NPDC056783]|uniref:PIN domain-containing protein n=1 Tax=Kitasatospora sp. NPDC056783 TaxID=3345943 RepID=UPI003677433E
MYLALHPGADRENALMALRDVATNVGNLYSGSQLNAGQLVLAYLEWANHAVERLTNQLSEREIERLIFTRRYEHLLASAADFGAGYMEKFTNSLVRLELRQRQAAFEAAVHGLQKAISSAPDVRLTVVFDTCMFIQHPQELEFIDWAELTGVSYGIVSVMLPIVVVDELDRLKEHTNKQTRYRARRALKAIDRRFVWGKHRRFTLLHQEGSLRVACEVLFDPPGHTRLPITDDEIVDRALAARPVVGGSMKLFTYDTGMSTRAGYAGLDVEKLSDAEDG